MCPTDLCGAWVLTRELFGYEKHSRLELEMRGDLLSGRVDGHPLEGSTAAGGIQFIVDSQYAIEQFVGQIAGDQLHGTAKHQWRQGSEVLTLSWRARRSPKSNPSLSRHHTFVPIQFAREYSGTLAPVLNISSGDSVLTTTIDAGGVDEHGMTRALAGNPLTGPFYVDTAMPGDVLAIDIMHLRLNRDWAVSADAIVPRAMDGYLATRLKGAGTAARWHLDHVGGIARPEPADGPLGTFVVPLRPVLGCLGLAPGFGSAAPPSDDSGLFGGNLDYNEIVEGTTVFLNVQQPGGLLYIGDAHAVQGDGELNGSALETSAKIQFRVRVLGHRVISTPRVETATHLVSLGLSGSLDDALRRSTAGLFEWIEEQLDLAPSAIAQLIGAGIEYRVVQVANRNVSVAAKFLKSSLNPLYAKHSRRPGGSSSSD